MTKRTVATVVALTTLASFGLGISNPHSAGATPEAAAESTLVGTPGTDASHDSSEADPAGVRDYIKLGMAGWKIHTSGKQVRSGALIKINNTVSGSFLGWKHQRFGVDLGWHGSHKPNIKFIAKRGRVIKYGEPIAIWVADKPGKNRKKRHLVYKRERWGINIGWDAKPKHDWYLVGGKKGSPVKPGEQLIIRNKTAEQKHKKSRKPALRADLVFCARNKGGAWLKWGHDCSKTDRVRSRGGR